MKPKELEMMPLRVEKLFFELQDRVMADVVRRIHKTGMITSTADYQLQKIYIFGNSTEFIESEIKRISGLTDPEVWKLYDDIVEKEYTRNRGLYEQVNANFIPYEENEMLQSWTKAVVRQTNNDVINITRSLGFTVDMGGRKVFTPLSEYYQKYLDKACMDIVTGSFSYNTVLRRVVKEMAASGLQTVDYASGHKNNAVVASRRAIMTGVRQLAYQINEMNAEKLGTDSYEVEWHSGSRPEHWWGGMVFTKQELIDICGLGTGPGLGGWNCYHTYYAFIPGVSVRTYTDGQLREMNAREKEKKLWNGKEYNAYEASQQQRRMETKMRAQRIQVKLLKSGKADDETIQAAQSKYLHTLRQYHGFSSKMGLPEQMERVYMDGLGRIAPGKLKTVKKRAIIKKKGTATNPAIKKPKQAVPIKLNYEDKQSAIDGILKNHGIHFVDSKKYPMDEGLLCECASWLDAFTEKYKDFAKNNPCSIPEIRCLAPSKMKNAVGQYIYYSNSKMVQEIGLNGKYHSDMGLFKQYVKDCVDTKWYSQNASTHKTFVHEYGHHVSNSLKWMTNNPGFQHDFIKECIDEFRVSSGYKYSTHVGMGDYVSRYAASSESELFAEAFAEYFGGENPREFAMIFGGKLEKILKKV